MRDDEAMNNGPDPTFGDPPCPYTPGLVEYRLGWKENTVMIVCALVWYGGFFLYWHDILLALAMGTMTAIVLMFAAVFFSGEWVK